MMAWLIAGLATGAGAALVWPEQTKAIVRSAEEAGLGVVLAELATSASESDPATLDTVRLLAPQPRNQSP